MTYLRSVLFRIVPAVALWLSLTVVAMAQTPVQQNGQLRVIGTKLCNQYGNAIQLRGMSTHGIQWYGWGGCLNEASLNALAYDWGADVLRISIYVQEGGYESNPTGYTNQVKTLINEATERGMYALVDWHQLSPGDPNYNLARAKTFFTEIANTYKNQNNIIYDVANEPNGVSWATIKTYADQIIPVIRAIDSDAVVLVGTHAWASMGISDGRSAQDIVNNPLSFTNIMYTFHFYAKDHQTQYLNELSWAADRLPVFVTEFGSQEASGDGPNDFNMTQRYIDLMREKKISWTNWNFSDDFRTGAVWKTGACPNGPWTTSNLKESGVWIRDKMLNPADNFPGGTTNQAPTVSLTAPATGATFAATATVTISANAADADGSIASVRFYQGATLLGTDTSAPYSFSWTNVAAGSYTITAVATDNANATTTSSAVTITVTGTSAPNLALNKAVTVSSVELAGYEGGKAVDGNTTTRWSSAQVASAWIYVDLGATYNVNRIRITWEAAYGRDYQLQVSADAQNWTTIKSVTGNTTLTNDHTGLNGSGRFVRINGTARGTEWGYSIFELEVYGSTTSTVSNVALNKAVTTSSVEGTGFEGSKAVDGNTTTTRWASVEYTPTEWIYVDLGATYSISRIRIVWEAAYGRDYQLQVSADAQNWTTVKTVTGNTTLTNDHTGLSGSGRFVRIYATTRGTEWGYSIYELEVYGAPAIAGRQQAYTEIIPEETESSGLSVYPNPADDNVTLQLSKEWQGGVITLHDAAGVLLRKEAVTTTEQTLSVSTIPTGLYLIKVTKGKRSAVRKISKK